MSFARLPVAQYPDIAPPTINVTGQYPGASADVVASTVVSPIEDQINGVENMIYMSSNSTSDGKFTIAVSFELGTNLDIAQVQVQNRVAIAQPRLPIDVRNIGVTVTKASPDLMMVVHIYSPDKSRDGLFISNYATLEIKDQLTRVDGVGSITVFGVRDFAMRVWLDPDRLQSLNMTASDVLAALQGQNIQVASGVLNQQPMSPAGPFEVAVQTLAGSPSPTSSPISSSSAPPARWCGSRTWRGSSSRPRTTRRIPISTAIPRWRSPSTSGRARTRWRRRRASSTP